MAEINLPSDKLLRGSAKLAATLGCTRDEFRVLREGGFLPEIRKAGTGGRTSMLVMDAADVPAVRARIEARRAGRAPEPDTDARIKRLMAELELAIAAKVRAEFAMREAAE